LSNSDSAEGLRPSCPRDQGSEKPRRDASLPGGIGLFFACLAVLALIRVVLGYIALPLNALPLTNLAIAILFLAAPIVALFFGANARWNWRTAAAFVAGGIVVQFGLVGLSAILKGPPPVIGVFNALGQAALPCWCVGLGALVATLIKDKNLILPIAIFLAAYDFLLILTPIGYSAKFMKAAMPVLTKVAGQIPTVSAHPTHGFAQPGYFVGMADFVFLAMFFIAIFRFGMRAKQTLAAVIAGLLVYLVLVMFFGDRTLFGMGLDKLPAMVPIGLAVLLVNWREFRLTRDELIGTFAVAAFMIALVAFAATRPKSQPEPSTPVSGQAPPARAGSPGPASRG